MREKDSADKAKTNPEELSDCAELWLFGSELINRSRWKVDLLYGLGRQSGTNLTPKAEVSYDFCDIV